MYRSFVKRFIDIMISFTLLVLTLPIMILVFVAIKLESKGPAIFRQERIGLNGQTFWIYKFRSMCQNAEYSGSGVYSGKDDDRVTRIGKFIRATSIDELPQMVNVLIGKMSLIGPRPPLTYHPWPIEDYTPQQRHMFDVRPGVTGWAQVHGRKEVEWNERIKLNCWYAEHVSFWLDLKIIAKTVFVVFTNENNENIGATVQRKAKPQKRK